MRVWVRCYPCKSWVPRESAGLAGPFWMCAKCWRSYWQADYEKWLADLPPHLRVLAGVFNDAIARGTRIVIGGRGD